MSVNRTVGLMPCLVTCNCRPAKMKRNQEHNAYGHVIRAITKANHVMAGAMKEWDLGKN